MLQSLWVSNFVYFYTFHGLKALKNESARTAGKDLLLASIAGRCIFWHNIIISHYKQSFIYWMVRLVHELGARATEEMWGEN